MLSDGLQNDVIAVYFFSLLTLWIIFVIILRTLYFCEKKPFIEHMIHLYLKMHMSLVKIRALVLSSTFCYSFVSITSHYLSFDIRTIANFYMH